MGQTQVRMVRNLLHSQHDQPRKKKRRRALRFKLDLPPVATKRNHQARKVLQPTIGTPRSASESSFGFWAWCWMSGALPAYNLTALTCFNHSPKRSTGCSTYLRMTPTNFMVKHGETETLGCQQVTWHCSAPMTHDPISSNIPVKCGKEPQVIKTEPYSWHVKFKNNCQVEGETSLNHHLFIRLTFIWGIPKIGVPLIFIHL